MKVLELFAGYGSQHMALNRLGIDCDCDISEIDKYAIATYNMIHGETKNYGDICKIDENSLPYYDLITFSFPCTDISLAGKIKGLTKGTGTRSSLLWECERIIAKVKPKYLLLENVKNLVGKKFKADFDEWLKVLSELGYNNYWQVLNAKDYNIPQNRERVFVVSIRKDADDRGYKFPIKSPLMKRLKHILETSVDPKYYLKGEKAVKLLEEILSKNIIEERVTADGSINSPKIKEVSNCITARYDAGVSNQKSVELVAVEPVIKQLGMLDIKGNEQTRRVYGVGGISPCLNTMQGGNRQPKILDDYRIRKLTPRECWRLMGVSDDDFDKIKGISNSQLYKMAGNSIVVDVLEHIFERLLK